MNMHRKPCDLHHFESNMIKEEPLFCNKFVLIHLVYFSFFSFFSFVFLIRTLSSSFLHIRGLKINEFQKITFIYYLFQKYALADP